MRAWKTEAAERLLLHFPSPPISCPGLARSYTFPKMLFSSSHPHPGSPAHLPQPLSSSEEHGLVCTRPAHHLVTLSPSLCRCRYCQRNVSSLRAWSVISTDLGAAEQREPVLAKQPGAHELHSLICGQDSPQADSKMPTPEIQGVIRIERVETGYQFC